MAKYKVLELFAGAGGLAFGMKKAGFDTVGLVEMDRNACLTLRSNFSPQIVFERDITSIVSFKEELKIDTVDVITGGFPCQAFSYAGNGKGLNDTRGTLFYDMARAIKEFQPKVFIGENVKGLTSHDNGNTLKTIIETFSELGYKTEYKVLNSNDYGVPQNRYRIIIVGIRNDIYEEKGDFSFPEPRNAGMILRDILFNVPESIGAEYNEAKKEILEMIPAGGCWKDLPEDIAKEYMKKSYYLGGGKTGIARRQSYDEPGLTVLTTPSQKQTERCHPEYTRPFTIRENARIQSFPDDYVFEGPITSQYRQIGNAVPVNLAKEVGLSVLSYLNN